jgi:hypothetical protein
VANQLAPKSQFVSECNSALATRRLWAIPATAVGIIVAGATFLQRRKASAGGI